MRKIIVVLLISLAILSCYKLNIQHVTKTQQTNEIKEEAAYNIINLELKGSKIFIAKPKKWNKKLYIFAHGFRHKDTPLKAEIWIGDFYDKLLNDGWMIAASSYRRNGWIIEDAIEDIDFLKQYICKKYGKPDFTVLVGNSLGGMIAGVLSEKENPSCDAIIAAGVSFKNLKTMTYKPNVPVLFLSNQTETKGATDYISQVNEAEVKPVLWTIERDGHCNYNEIELEEAFWALLKYQKDGVIEENNKILHKSKPLKSTATYIGNRAEIMLEKCPEIIFTRFTEEDLIKLKLIRGDFIKVSFKDRYYFAQIVSTQNDVPFGQWAAFMLSNGYLFIAQNGINATTTMDCTEGGLISIEPSEPFEYPVYSEEVIKIWESMWNPILQNKPEEAIQFLQNNPEILNDYVGVNVNLIWAYLQNNEIEKGLSLLKKFKDLRIDKENKYFIDYIKQDLEYFKEENIKINDLDKIKELCW